MYDNLESLGNTPNEVEQSLIDLGLSTARLTRADARGMLNKALDGTPLPKRDRDIFIATVLSNNCVINGTFHHVVDDVVLGCPITLGFNIPKGDDLTVSEYKKVWEELYPSWGLSFYSHWDDLLNDYSLQATGDEFADAFVLEGE